MALRPPKFSLRELLAAISLIPGYDHPHAFMRAKAFCACGYAKMSHQNVWGRDGSVVRLSNVACEAYAPSWARMLGLVHAAPRARLRLGQGKRWRSPPLLRDPRGPTSNLFGGR